MGIRRTGFQLVQCARDWLGRRFLNRQPSSHTCVSPDDDLGFDPDAIMKLIDSDLEAVGGVPIRVKCDAGDQFTLYTIRRYGGEYLQPVDRLPGGFLLVKRHAVEAVAARCEHYQQYYRPSSNETRRTAHVFDVVLVDDPANPGTKILIGEDYLFCRRLSEAGFPLYARTDIHFSHIGRHAWSGRLSGGQRQVMGAS